MPDQHLHLLGHLGRLALGEPGKLPPRQDRAYVRPPMDTQNFVPTRYEVE